MQALTFKIFQSFRAYLKLFRIYKEKRKIKYLLTEFNPQRQMGPGVRPVRQVRWNKKSIIHSSYIKPILQRVVSFCVFSAHELCKQPSEDGKDEQTETPRGRTAQLQFRKSAAQVQPFVEPVELWNLWKQLYKMIYFINRKHENKIKINVKIVLTKITKNKHTQKNTDTQLQTFMQTMKLNYKLSKLQNTLNTIRSFVKYCMLSIQWSAFC